MTALPGTSRDIAGFSLLPDCLGHTKTIYSLAALEVLRVTVIREGPGVVEVPRQENPRIIVHAGPPVRIACKRGNHAHVGLTVYGDIDVVPAGIESRWDISGVWRALVVILSQQVLNRIVHTCGKDAAGWELQSRFQIRNPQIEHLAWTLKAEFEQGCPNGRIFVESLATALGMEIVRDRGLKVESGGAMRNDVSSRRLKQVLAYIDDHLAEDLSLQAIAGEMAVSVSWLKQHFRKSLGVPLHHYIMRQRVERAADLLTYRKSPIREVALETGFSHQSHLAKFMRRILGVSPNELRK